MSFDDTVFNSWYPYILMVISILQAVTVIISLPQRAKTMILRDITLSLFTEQELIPEPCMQCSFSILLEAHLRAMLYNEVKCRKHHIPTVSYIKAVWQDGLSSHYMHPTPNS